MSVMQELASVGVEGGLAAIVMHPLVLTLFSAALALYAIARRQSRQRRAALEKFSARSLAANAAETPTARAGRATASFRAADPVALRAASPLPEPGTETKRQARFQKPGRQTLLAPVGPPAQPPMPFGLAQMSLRTTPRYRLFGCALVLLTQAIAFGTPLLLPSGVEPALALRLFGYGLCLLALWHAFWALFWRLDYDSIGLSSRNRWLQPEAQMWRALTGISSDGPFITLFHFADGLVMRVPNFIQGRREMMQTARSWLHRDSAPDRS